MKRRMLCLCLSLIMLFGLAACRNTPNSEVSENPTSNAPNDDGSPVVQTGNSAPETLTIGTDQELGAFLEGGDSANCYIGQMMIYDRIFNYDSVNKEYTSDILESWEYEDDLTFVMHVRSGVTFANGNALTASDILYTLRGFIERNSALSTQFDAFDFDASYTEDEYTLVLKTTQPYGPLYDALSVYVYDEDWVEEVTWDSEAWTNSPNGSGPYELTEYVSGAYAVFNLRDDYWAWDLYGDDLSLPQTVTLRYYGEASTMYIDLENGALDIASGISKEDLARSADSDEITAKVIASGDVRWFAMNVNYNEALADERVRLAIAHAVDWEAIGIASIGDQYIAADSMISIKSQFYTPIGTYEYDPDLSRQLLEEAGYGDGLTLTYATLETGATYAEFVQGYLDDVGITVSIETADFGTTIVRWLDPYGSDLNCQISATGVPTGEPWISLQQLVVGMGAFPGITIDDDEMTELLFAAVYSIDPEVRQENYTAFAQYVYDHALAIPTYQANGTVAWRNDVISDVTFNMYRQAVPQQMIWA